MELAHGKPFQSAGVHRLELGIEVLNADVPSQGQGISVNVVSASAGKAHAAGPVETFKPLGQTQGRTRMSWLARHQKEQEELRTQSANALWPQRAIAADNLGYTLLRKAGWQEGSGLGVNEQGRVTPIQAWLQKGNRGVGFDHKAAQEQQAKQQEKSNSRQDAVRALKRQEAAAARAVGTDRSQMIKKLVADELNGEDTATKVKQHRQLMQQEEEDAKRRHISRFLSRALNDPMDNPFSSGDSNPLGRRHRLTALNPLLDDE